MGFWVGWLKILAFSGRIESWENVTEIVGDLPGYAASVDFLSSYQNPCRFCGTHYYSPYAGTMFRPLSVGVPPLQMEQGWPFLLPRAFTPRLSYQFYSAYDGGGGEFTFPGSRGAPFNFPTVSEAPFANFNGGKVRYPVRDPRTNWTFPGHLSGNKRQAIIKHLAADPGHLGHFSIDTLLQMSDEELISLHSDDHEHRVNWQALHSRAQ